jgi:hypothetical protein
MRQALAASPPRLPCFLPSPALLFRQEISGRDKALHKYRINLIDAKYSHVFLLQSISVFWKVKQMIKCQSNAYIVYKRTLFFLRAM